jgi:biopolymer transport protein TolR
MTAKSGLAATSELNVTPMLDVLLVLLIIFMAASMRVRHTIDANLPQACAGQCDGGTPIVLEVLPGPTYRINRSRVPRGTLAQELARVYRGRPDKTLQVAGRPGVSYNDVVMAMDVAKASGVQVLGIVPKGSY